MEAVIYFEEASGSARGIIDVRVSAVRLYNNSRGNEAVIDSCGVVGNEGAFWLGITTKKGNRLPPVVVHGKTQLLFFDRTPFESNDVSKLRRSLLGRAVRYHSRFDEIHTVVLLDE